jgi:hypothetical protein
MKFLITLLIIIIAGAAGYFAHPAIYKVVEKLRPEKKVIVLTEQQKKAEAARIAATPPPINKTEAQKLMDQIRGMPAPTNTNATNTTPTPTPTSSDDEIDRKFPMPKLRTIEEITQNWTSVPSRAFPRKVRSMVPIEFVIAAGKTTVPAGTEVYAHSFENSQMTVSQSPDPNGLKTKVTLASTDFQEMMTGLYNKYVEKMTAKVELARKNARYARDNPAPPPPPVDEQAKIAGSRPSGGTGGAVPEMLASISAKDVTEFTASSIQSWGPVEYVTEEGKGYWSCTIVVRMSTIFGDVDTDVQAFMNNGKVVKWIYAGSKEPVQ